MRLLPSLGLAGHGLCLEHRDALEASLQDVVYSRGDLRFEPSDRFKPMKTIENR